MKQLVELLTQTNVWPPGRHRRPTTWMKAIQQDLKSNNLSLSEATDVAQKFRIFH